MNWNWGAISAIAGAISAVAATLAVAFALSTQISIRGLEQRMDRRFAEVRGDIKEVVSKLGALGERVAKLEERLEARIGNPRERRQDEQIGELRRNILLAHLEHRIGTEAFPAPTVSGKIDAVDAQRRIITIRGIAGSKLSFSFTQDSVAKEYCDAQAKPIRFPALTPGHEIAVAYSTEPTGEKTIRLVGLAGCPR